MGCCGASWAVCWIIDLGWCWPCAFNGDMGVACKTISPYVVWRGMALLLAWRLCAEVL